MRLELRAPSRLHFGMLSFGQPEVRQFGGIGAMVERPGIRLQISSAPEFRATGPLCERVQATVARMADRAGLARLPACHIEVLTAPQQHTGLGVGTSLALAVVYAVRRFLDLPELSASELAEQAGRGRRSAVGTYGFLSGGFIVEAGKLPNETLAPQLARLEIPAAWRFVLISGQAPSGVSGPKEQQAFASLPPVPAEISAELCREVVLEMVPALQGADFDRFSASLYRYGHLAGNCFAAAQGGPFAHPHLDRLVAKIQELGVAGVGQTSWGPTLFALVHDERQAAEFCAELTRHSEVRSEQMTTAAPCNAGVRLLSE